MTKNDQSNTDSFIVKESKPINYVAAIAFLIMFGVAVESGSIDFKNSFYLSIFFIVFLLGTAISFLVKASNNKAIIEINETGIFYHSKLVSSWEHYVASKVIQESKATSIKDNFVLLIEYFKVEAGTDYICRIALTNTQNKSEEAILAAIEEYLNKYMAKNS